MTELTLAVNDLRESENDLAEKENRLRAIAAQTAALNTAKLDFVTATNTLKSAKASDIACGYSGVEHPELEDKLAIARQNAEEADILAEAQQVLAQQIDAARAEVMERDTKLRAAMADRFTDVAGPVRSRVQANLAALVDDLHLLAAMGKASNAGTAFLQDVPEFLAALMTPAAVSSKADEVRRAAIDQRFVTVRVWRDSMSVETQGLAKKNLFFKFGQASMDYKPVEDVGALLGVDPVSLNGTCATCPTCIFYKVVHEVH